MKPFAIYLLMGSLSAVFYADRVARRLIRTTTLRGMLPLQRNIFPARS
jgi:hypothetical protein